MKSGALPRIGTHKFPLFAEYIKVIMLFPEDIMNFSTHTKYNVQFLHDILLTPYLVSI